jgi:hypothetical protein
MNPISLVRILNGSAARADPRGSAAEVADTAVDKALRRRDKHELGQYLTPW